MMEVEDNTPQKPIEEKTFVELLHVLRQFFAEDGMPETAHQIEQERLIYLDLDYLKQLVEQSKTQRAIQYLEKFEPLCKDNADDLKFFRVCIFKLKYLDTVQHHVVNNPYPMFHKLLTEFEDYKNDPQFTTAYRRLFEEATAPECDFSKIRLSVLKEIIKLKNHESFKNIIELPKIPPSRLRDLINQSFTLQVRHCTLCKKNENAPEGRKPSTLYLDHCPSDPHEPIHDNKGERKRSSSLNNFETIPEKKIKVEKTVST
eukprot:TRINITY_DN2203_c0_g1_i2.p1 TRINITY_DN2203_c0_g1~~TRINITY_DN2203_c0_g1_i2.p1  ORF type:complete len:259 (+),score=57.15 TRINITY_DN2203_c0_g1_i2:81-857(+)